LLTGVAVCLHCGAENPKGKKFCGDCGARLSPSGHAIAQERKIVSSLFCDLVGFTPALETADPEDVDRVLAAYFAVARQQIEAFGGVVEKFIGDAVVGVFGVPSAHEDDPERAVRAALRIAEDAERLSGLGGGALRVRIGVNTGEALVRVDVSAASGEGFITGDPVNTAARLQEIAPIGGVAVGLLTYESTRNAIDYEELKPARLRGKTEPVRVFHAKGPRVGNGAEPTRTQESPFVGREIDLALLKGMFERTVASSSVQLVTVVGEPGIGKSRIVTELVAHVEERPELVQVRRGHCLPYGDGITFWALGEILKAHTGVLDSDSPEAASKKLEAALPEGPEREWFRQRLLPLLGVEASSTAARDELFSAWRSFLEHIARERPTVLVFEDLHWADEAMLGFIEHVALHAQGVPLLLVCTARPSLLESHPGFAAELPNAMPLNLTPLSTEETARLVSGLLETAVLPADMQQPVLDRSGGNPLFVQEFVRLLRDRALLVRDGSSWRLAEDAEVPVPHSVQALIAARIDTLAGDVKSLLADAAVVGKVFWADALAAIGSRETSTVTEMLVDLTRRELVWPERRSSLADEAEYSFGHVLVRDVSYSQLPRTARISRHVAAAAWIETKVADRIEDFADVLAHHYSTALDLAEAAGQENQAAELTDSAFRFLTLAGERALGLDTGAALTSFERALALTPPGHFGRPASLSRFGEAAQHAARVTDARDALEEAIAAFKARGDPAAAARAMSRLSTVLHFLADAHWAELPAEAVALLRRLPPGPELVNALAELARAEILLGKPEAALRDAEHAVALAGELRLPRPARALGYLGLSRGLLGDLEGAEDMREAIAIATQAGEGREVGILHNNLGLLLWGFEGPAAALEEMDAGTAFARARGLNEVADLIACSALPMLVDSGEHDQALENAAALEKDAKTSGNALVPLEVHAAQAHILTLRGRVRHAEPMLESLEFTTHEAATADYAALALPPAALAREALGDHAAAARLLAELEADPGVRDTPYYVHRLPMIVRTALVADGPDLATRLTDGVQPRNRYAGASLVAAHAAIAEARSNHRAARDGYAEAAQCWRRLGVVPELGYALLGGGRTLKALGEMDEAAETLTAARAAFQTLQAASVLTEIDLVLERVTAPPARN
jgi:class 3 adenylate cyclase/tetratricopeptide (TPR) repeat protein